MAVDQHVIDSMAIYSKYMGEILNSVKYKYTLEVPKRIFNQMCIDTLYGEYRRGAKQRGYSFDIVPKDFAELIAKPCRYCGAVAHNAKRLRAKKYQGQAFRYNGIDRIDNEKGYTLENCAACCQPCNRMKLDMGEAAFLTQCRAIMSFQTRGNYETTTRL